MITADGRVKILDFGLAKRQRDLSESDSNTAVLSRAGTIVGTVPYMSPEQLQAHTLDLRTDIFSLGVILFEMAVGVRPFRGDSNADVMSSILRDPPGTISDRRPDLPRQLQEILDRALNKVPAGRYPSVGELLHALERLRGNAHGTSDASMKRAGDIRSIAVMPLDNLSRDPAQEYFAEGMTEALITDLAKMTGLKVISRMSVMQYKGAKKPLSVIARELGVDAVVEGSVVAVEPRIRVTAQLIDARTERHLWAERYDREMHDVLRLQDELVRAIATEVKAKLVREPPAGEARRIDPEVYRLDLKGRHYWNKRTEASFHAGLESFQRAIDLDPAYAPAYVGLADCYAMLCNYGILPPAVGHPRVRAALSQALQLDPSSGEAYRTLALCQWQFEFDWARAEESYRKALELNPNSGLTTYWYGAFLGVIGRQFEGLEVLRRAEELDPLSLTIPAVQGWLMYFANRYDLAIGYYRRVLAIDPNLMLAHWFLGQASAEIGAHDEAVASLEKAMELAGPITRLFGYLGYALGRAGRADDARARLADLELQTKERYVPRYFPALIHAGLGEKERALDLLEQAWEQKDTMLRDLLVDPPWNSLRGEPRFEELMRKMNYP
jgi:TolB-like protein/Tfp pilus assembly protein PilF